MRCASMFSSYCLRHVHDAMTQDFMNGHDRVFRSGLGVVVKCWCLCGRRRLIPKCNFRFPFLGINRRRSFICIYFVCWKVRTLRASQNVNLFMIFEEWMRGHIHPVCWQSLLQDQLITKRRSEIIFYFNQHNAKRMNSPKIRCKLVNSIVIQVCTRCTN